MRKTPARDYLPALTGLRFSLAFWVILHHICGRGMILEVWANSLPAPVAQFIRGGYLAVQTFFILSGFVLARTYANTIWNRDTLRSFATARFARIYPVYLVSLVMLSPFMIEMLRSPIWTMGQRANLISNYIFVFQGWTGSLGVGWNTPAWSLSCEFFFYACFPILFLALRRARWTAASVAMGISILMPVLLDHAGVPWRWKPIYCLADFIAGIAAARIYTLLENSGGWRNRGFLLYIPAIVIGGWLIIHPGFANGTEFDLNTFLRPLNVAMLVGFAFGGGWLARLFSTRSADFLGKASYSMYVLHVPVLWWYGRYYVYGKLHPPRAMAAAIYLTLVVVVAGFVFQWLEAPASSWIRKWEKRRFPQRTSAYETRRVIAGN